MKMGCDTSHIEVVSVAERSDFVSKICAVTDALVL